MGDILPLTGEQAKFGEIEKLSFDMALEEINTKGGINGKMLEFVIEDDTGRSLVEKLIAKSASRPHLPACAFLLPSRTVRHYNRLP